MSRQATDYDRAYAALPIQKKHRAARNKVRRRMLREGRVKKGDGREIDHIDGDPMNGSAANLRVISRRANRAKH